MNLLFIVLAASLSFLIAFIAIPSVIRLSLKKRLFDIPDERKLHSRPIASLGGVGVFAGFFFTSLLFVNIREFPEFQYYFAAMFFMFLVGLKDDLVPTAAMKKLLAQIVVAGIIIHLGGQRLHSFYGFMGIEEIPEIISYAITYFVIVVIVNAFNLIDGIDGLSGSLGVLTMSTFGGYFFYVGEMGYAMLAFTVVGGLLAFLIFNHHPAKIFMGDSGSLMLGVVNSILVIRFINVASVGPVDSIVHPSGAVAVGIAILILPLLDTSRVFSIRILDGRSPFSPDKNHIHHLLLATGLNHAMVTYVCLLTNASFILLAIFASGLGSSILIPVIVGLGLIGISFLAYNRRTRRGLLIAKAKKSGSTTLKAKSPIIIKENAAAPFSDL